MSLLRQCFSISMYSSAIDFFFTFLVFFVVFEINEKNLDALFGNNIRWYKQIIKKYISDEETKRCIL